MRRAVVKHSRVRASEIAERVKLSKSIAVREMKQVITRLSPNFDSFHRSRAEIHPGAMAPSV